MKLGTMAVTAALALLTFSLTPAEAGQKARKHQQWTEHGNVHIDSHVSSKNLKALEKQLKGHQKAAVSEELHHRQLSYEKRSREQYAKDLGEALTNLKGEQAILNLWGAGTHFGTKHKHGHSDLPAGLGERVSQAEPPVHPFVLERRTGRRRIVVLNGDEGRAHRGI